jgi:LysR family hydrogen peroxide-inducible transcriptional activator
MVGITIIPHLATIHFDKQGKEKLRHFKPPVPVREISLVTYRHFVKKGLLQILEKEISDAVKPHINTKLETDVIAAS